MSLSKIKFNDIDLLSNLFSVTSNSIDILLSAIMPLWNGLKFTQAGNV